MARSPHPTPRARARGRYLSMFGINSQHNEFNPIFYDEAALTLDASGTFWYSDTPAMPQTKWDCSAFPRIATWGRCVAGRRGGGGSRDGSRQGLASCLRLRRLQRAGPEWRRPSAFESPCSFTVKESGQQLLFFNTHFDHESEDARTKAAEMLLQQLPTLSQGVPTIVSGARAAARSDPPTAFHVLHNLFGCQCRCTRTPWSLRCQHHPPHACPN